MFYCQEFLKFISQPVCFWKAEFNFTPIDNFLRKIIVSLRHSQHLHHAQLQFKSGCTKEATASLIKLKLAGGILHREKPLQHIDSCKLCSATLTCLAGQEAKEWEERGKECG